MITIPDSDRPLAAALEAKGLPYPLPDRWEDPDPEMIRAYIHAAQDVVTAPGMDLELITDFSAAILEHITTKYRDCWDDMVTAYFAAPAGIERSQFAFWLMQAAGSSKKYVARVLNVVLAEDPALIWDFLPWLFVRINQEQWDLLAPNLTDPVLSERIVNFTRRNRSRIEKKGVTPWIPGVEL